MQKTLSLVAVLAAVALFGCASTRPTKRAKRAEKPVTINDIMQAQTISPPISLDPEVLLMLRTNKLVYKVGEPVVIDFRLHNLGKSFKCFYSELLQQGFLTAIDITKGAAPIYRSPPLRILKNRPPELSHFAWIPPSGFLGMTYVAWRPTEPGTYRLAVTYRNQDYQIVLANMRFTNEQLQALGDRAFVRVWQGSATSNAVEITVTK